MSNQLQALWVEKYRPQNLSQYVFQNEHHREVFQRFVDSKSIPQLILAGVRGTGKTTLARILINAMGVDPSDVLTINASQERGIDTFRTKIEGFATSMAMGTFKIVHLEEADNLTPDAQKALKAFMEDVSDTVRFIFTCNHVNKIIIELRSRCQEFTFKSADQDEIAETMAIMLAEESVKFKLDALYQVVAAGYPDVRKIINLLQEYSGSGELRLPASKAEAGSDYKLELIDLITQDKWVDARKLICANVASEDWENLYRFLYENLDKSPKFKTADKWEAAILIVAEHLYKHSLVADPEINAAAMLIQLGQV